MRRCAGERRACAGSEAGEMAEDTPSHLTLNSKKDPLREAHSKSSGRGS